MLDSQKYPNTTRTITGLVNSVFNTDTIIICDTSLGPVQIELLEIPADKWNTTRKFYFIDSGNASVNNITITAPVGYTINDQPTLVLNANNQNALVRVGSNTDYLAYTSTGLGSNLAVLNQGVQITPSAVSMNFLGIQASAVGNAVTIQNNFISGTYAQISALASSNSLIPSQGYEITDALYGSLPVKNIAVYLTAISTNELSLSGSGFFFNADYDNTGVYSGVSGYAGQLGCWSLSLLPVIGNVCIWNNLHYVNITGANGLTNPSLDAVNWSVLAYSVTNGYIAEVDTIKYDFSQNRIIERQDLRLNSVTWSIAFPGYDSFNNFRWGDNKCYLNTLIDSVLYNCNNIRESSYNKLNYSQVIVGTPTLGGSVEMTYSEFFTSNVFIPIQSSAGEVFLFNKVEFSQLSFIKNDLTGPGTFNRNIVSQSNLTNVNFEGAYNYNIFENASSSDINQIRTATISFNRIVNSILTITDNTGFITYNEVVNNSSLSVTQNTGNITNNLVQAASVMSLGINISSINYNKLNSQSQLNLTSNSNLVLNNDLFKTIFTSSVSQQGRLTDNILFSSNVSISNMTGNFQYNDFNTTNVTITTLNSAFSETFVKQGNLTLSNPSIAISEGIYDKGVGTIPYVLDLNDPTIFNANVLTIPIGIQEFFGIYTLLNCTGQTISQIINNQTTVPITFVPDANTIFFNRTGVGAAVANDIISNTGGAGYTLTFRTNGNDSIQIQRLGNLNGVINKLIFV